MDVLIKSGADPDTAKEVNIVLRRRGAVAERFSRALNLKSGGPWFKSFTSIILFTVVPSSTQWPCYVNSPLDSASRQLGFLLVYVLFAIFVYLFTVSPISTTVLNTFDTFIMLLFFIFIEHKNLLIFTLVYM